MTTATPPQGGWHWREWCAELAGTALLMWVLRSVSRTDLLGYTVAQLVGAVVGTATARLWGPDVAGPPVRWAAIAPPPELPEAVGVLIEAAATGDALLPAVPGAPPRADAASSSRSTTRLTTHTLTFSTDRCRLRTSASGGFVGRRPVQERRKTRGWPQ